MATKKAEPFLTEAEAGSQLWLKVREHITRRIAALRALNDDPALDAGKTARLRGQIKELKNLAALDKPALQTDEDDLFKD